MRSLAWSGAWLALASVLVMGGCPGGGSISTGIMPATYIGPLTCSMTGYFSDGTQFGPIVQTITTSVEVTQDGNLYIDSVHVYEGSIRHYTDNSNNPVTETTTSIDTNSHSIVVRGTMETTLDGGADASGTNTITIDQTDSGAVDVSTHVQMMASDGTTTMMTVQDCSGILTE